MDNQVVEEKIMQLLGAICQPRPAQAKVGTLPERRRVTKAEARFI
jgi:hypothetical protein